MDPDQICSVARFRDDLIKPLNPELYADSYEVTSSTHEDFTARGGGGHRLLIKIRSGRVELHGVSCWMS